MGNDNASDQITEKQSETVNKPWQFQPGQSGNPAGRPKRKTLTELIHAKLDNTPGGWEAIVNEAIRKALKDKEVLRTLWQYTDGMPRQSIGIDNNGGGPLEIKIVEDTTLKDAQKKTK